MQKEDLWTDTPFDPCWFLLDYTFNIFFKAYRILNNAKSESEDKKVKFNIFFKAYRIPNNAKAVFGSERNKFFGYTTLYESEIFKGGLDRCKEKNRGPKSRMSP